LFSEAAISPLTRRHANKSGACAEAHYTGAIAAYTRAIALDPTNAVCYANRAAAHIKTEQYGSAIADAGEAIKLNPKYIKVRLLQLCSSFMSIIEKRPG
jgi:tetratricopeptide (TPR) repeat protein